jgi:hypothetical protein
VKSDRRDSIVPEDRIPSTEDLARALESLLRRGVEPIEVVAIPELIDLVCVRTASSNQSPGERAKTFRKTLREVCRRLDPTELGDAALHTLGLSNNRGKSLGVRDRAAAAALGLTEANYRQNYRRQVVIKAVALELESEEHRIIQIRRREVQSDDEERNFRWVQAEYTYTISEEDYRDHHYGRVFLVEAMADHVTRFEHFYNWSGRGTEGTPVVTGGHQLDGQPRETENATQCFVRFRHPLAIGERARVEIGQDFYDAEEAFKPFLSSKCHFNNMERIVLRAQLPRSRLPQHVVLRTYDMGENGPMKEEEGTCNPRTGLIEWVPDDLIKGRRFVITWEYADGHTYPPNYEGGISRMENDG